MLGSGCAQVTQAAQILLPLLKNVLGVANGRRMIVAETNSWAGQQIGEVYDPCTMNESLGHRCG
jgi:hypothetical protein